MPDYSDVKSRLQCLREQGREHEESRRPVAEDEDLEVLELLEGFDYEDQRSGFLLPFLTEVKAELNRLPPAARRECLSRFRVIPVVTQPQFDDNNPLVSSGMSHIDELLGDALALLEKHQAPTKPRGKVQSDKRPDAGQIGELSVSGPKVADRHSNNAIAKSGGQDLVLTGRVEGRSSNWVRWGDQEIRMGDQPFCLLLSLVVARLDGKDGGYVHKVDLAKQARFKVGQCSEIVRRVRQNFPETIRAKLIDKSGDGKRRLGLRPEQVKFDRDKLLSLDDLRIRELAAMLPSLSVHESTS